MPTKILWSAAAKVELFPGTVDGDADLKNKASTHGALSGAITATLDQYIQFILRCRAQAAPTAGYFNIWLLRLWDGTTYEDGSVSSGVVTVPSRPANFDIPVRAVTTQQIISSPILLAPFVNFKVLIQNVTGQALTNTDNENELWYQLASDEAQTA